MARRRRLDPSALSASGAETPVAAPRPAAPIAQTAGEAAAAAAGEIARLRAEAAEGRTASAALEVAEAEGRILMDVALEAIDTRYLPRDRMDAPDPDDAYRALKASLAESGQRVPVDLVRLEENRFGLVAGWRRVRALRDLHWETGEDRFARVRALVRPEGARAQAFRAMVEENEVRADLGHYERGRICILAAADGAFEDAEAALAGLFAAASPARRSKIRSFMLVHEALGDLLAFPEHLPERLGLELAKALKWGRGEALRTALAGHAARCRGPEDEQTALRAALEARPEPDRPAEVPAPSPPTEPAPGSAATGRGSGRTGSRRTPDPARHRVLDLPGGIRIERRSFAGHTDLRLSGPGLDEETLEAALEALAERLGR